MNPVNLNFRSFSSPIRKTCSWMNRHILNLSPFVGWKTLIGGVGVCALVTIIGRLVYQRLHSPVIKPVGNLKNDRKIVALAELEPREENVQLVGDDSVFNFGKHLKTLDGQPIIPNRDDYFVFFKISDFAIRDKLKKTMRDGKYFEFNFDRSQVTGITYDFTIKSEENLVTYYDGIILPSTLFRNVRENVSFKWDDHTITLELILVKTLRVSDCRLFKGLIDLVAEKTEKRDKHGIPIQYPFHEIFPFLERMPRRAAPRARN